MFATLFYLALFGCVVGNNKDLQKKDIISNWVGTQISGVNGQVTLLTHEDRAPHGPTPLSWPHHRSGPQQGGVAKSRLRSLLPTSAHYDHNVRPGNVVWKSPPPKPTEARIGPVFRLPMDRDDDTQVRLEWSFVNLKVRPEKLTIEAIGPNKATWSVTVLDDALATTATWHLRETPSYSPLIEGFYTLQVHDQRGPSAPPKPGWLLADRRMTIGLYKPELDHVGQVLDVSECATCYRYIMKGVEPDNAPGPLQAGIACLLGALLTTVVIVLI